MRGRTRPVLAAAAMTLALLVACSPARQPRPAASAEAPAKPAAGADLKFAAFHTEQDAFTETEKWWAQQVAARTEGRVQVTPFYAGSLATVAETLNAVRDGSADLGTSAASVMAGQVPAISSFEPMGAYPADEQQWPAMMAQAEPVLKQIMNRAGVEYLWSQPGPGQSAVCRGKHLKSPADYRGLKLRTAGRWQGEQVQALGAGPVTIDPGELYLALQNGTVDCALFVNNLTLSFKLYEVAPYVTEMGLAVNLAVYIVNRGTWNRLDTADRAAIQQVSAEATTRSLTHLLSVQEAATQQLGQLGAQLYYLTPDEQQQLLRATTPVFERAAQQGGDLGAQLGRILAAARGS